MLQLVRDNRRYFLLVALAGLALRLTFILRFPGVVTDSFIYGDIAKNWLQHGIYGLGGVTGISPTYIRLPGYPAFLAAVWAIFGMEHYRAVLFNQMFFDLGTCFLIADMARRLLSTRAAKIAFLLAALCPFLADYSAAALTETLAIFFTALALDLFLLAMRPLDARRSFETAPSIGCGLAVGAGILLRPDGGLLLAALLSYLGWTAFRGILQRGNCWPPLAAAMLIGALSLAPLIPWTLRNLHTFHRFQPLAPRYANEEDEFVPMGFNRWVKTWIVDYSSVEEIYWVVPGDEMKAEKLPSRAFDSSQQRDQTVQLIGDYNDSLHVTPDLDQRFQALAADRIAHAPLRYYLELPAARIADMWLRPRTEKLPIDTRWWEFTDDSWWVFLAIGLGLINLLYVAAAFWGGLRSKLSPGFGLLLWFVFLRSAFLGTLENPEPRYTLECYPVVIVLAVALFRRTPLDEKW